MIRPERRTIAVGIGLVGILTAAALVLFGDTRVLNDTWTGEIGVVIIAGPSAGLAGLVCGGMFGHPHLQGWVLAFMGACLSTLLGAAIAGTFVLPLIGSVIAPTALLDQAIANPIHVCLVFP